jgi:hypothetical protein
MVIDKDHLKIGEHGRHKAGDEADRIIDVHDLFLARDPKENDQQA